MKNLKQGLSLVEVLVSTVIIAVAIYGIMLAMSAQQLASARARENKIIKSMHYQLVREIISAERDARDPNWADNNLSANDTLRCDALGPNFTITYNDRVTSAFGGGSPFILESNVSWTTPNGRATPTHTVRVYFVR